MAGGVNLSKKSSSANSRAAAVTADRSIAPKFISAADKAADYNNNYQVVNANNAEKLSLVGALNAKNMLNQSASPATPSNQKTVADALASVGVGFNPQQNPLNKYANYTYHIRWFLTTEADAYNLDPNKPAADRVKKTIIAESGVTAGFNIEEFEYKVTVGPGIRTMNTIASTWSMNVTEPYGISLIDKIRTAAMTQPVIEYMRAPYFIDIWFNGYDEDGNLMDPNLFYQVYRVSLTDIDVRLTEAGSKYTVTGYIDGQVGHSNEISIPPNQIEIKAKTIKEAFDNLATEWNNSIKKVNEQNFALVEYKFNVPPEIANWKLKAAEVDKQSQRSSDLDQSYNDGTTTIRTGNGSSVENIVNQILAMSPQADSWLKGNNQGAGTGNSLLTTKGISKWLMVHSSVKIIGWDSYTGDYIRQITYSLVPFETVKSSGDKDTVTKLLEKNTQLAKLAYLADKANNALVKQYDYIYTGRNTEVIKFDIHIDSLFQITLPQWEGTNIYHNYTQGPLFADSVADQKVQGNYSKQRQLQQQLQQVQNEIGDARNQRELDALQNRQAQIVQAQREAEQAVNGAIYFGNQSQGQLVVSQAAAKNPVTASAVASYSYLQGNTKAKRFAEDLRSLPIELDPMPIVVKQNNQPYSQNADQGGDSNKAMPAGSQTAVPSSRSFIGSILGNMFSMQSFMDVELVIRGDPYWMGQSNIADDIIAANPSSAPPDPTRASFISRDHMFILSFRSGENYDESTGLMRFDTTSEFFNGAYCVSEVTNNFKSGSFTQTLQAYKDAFAQKATSDIQATSNQTQTSQQPSGLGPR